MFVCCVLQDLQKQKELKEEELIELQKVSNDKKSKVDDCMYYKRMIFKKAAPFYCCHYFVYCLLHIFIISQFDILLTY